MGHGFEQISITEIRRLLREIHSISDSTILNQTKKPLVELFIRLEEERRQLEESEEVFTNMEEEGELEPNSETIELPIPEIQPSFGSKEWHDYVMRQFTEDELVEGSPTCDGCRRIVQKLIGNMVSFGVRDFVAPNNENQATATVVYEVQIRIHNENHPLYEFCENHEDFVLSFSDIADVNKFNTDEPYDRYPSATAATRAEGRVYRKLLGLKKIVAEERGVKAEENEEQWVEDEPIDEGQVAIIDMMCRPDRCDLNVLEFINIGRHKYATIAAVSKSVAQRMVQKLNKIQQSVDSRPENVGRYEADWRKT